MLDIEHFRNQLLAARKAILDVADARNASTATVMLDQSSVGRLSRMDALQQQAMAQNNHQRAGSACETNFKTTYYLGTAVHKCHSSTRRPRCRRNR